LGRESAPDVTRDETEVSNARAAIPHFIGEKRVAEYRLAALLAESPSSLPKQVDECDVTPSIDQPIPVGDGAALLKRRPDVREAERKLAASTARIGVAVGALYPTVTIGASAGLTGLASDLGNLQTQRYGYGPLISWAFPVNGETQKIKEARADSDAQLARFDGVVLNALRETESSLAANQADNDTVAALTGAQASAQQAADQIHALYLGGRASFISDLDATRALVSADSRLAAARTQLALDQVSLFLALGGGWQTTGPSNPAAGTAGG
jgi:outer membrane protein TolC